MKKNDPAKTSKLDLSIRPLRPEAAQVDDKSTKVVVVTHI